MNYTNRELSWMEFNRRVLNLASDESVPLFERLKFLSISSNNLDEFYMIRVGSIIDKMTKNKTNIDVEFDEIEVNRDYEKLSDEISEFVVEQKNVYAELIQKYDSLGYKIISDTKLLTEKSKKYINDYFDSKVYPLLTPLVFDAARPFPVIQSKSLNIALLIEDERYDYNMFGSVQLPIGIDRLIKIKAKDIPENEHHFILLEDLILFNIEKVFKNKKVLNYGIYRITRNADIDIDTFQGSLPDKMRSTLNSRKSSEIIRLEVNKSINKELFKFIKKALRIQKSFVYKIDGTLDFSFIIKQHGIQKYLGEGDLSYEFYEPQTPKDLIGENDIFDAIDRGDILLHHPYESFVPVIDFVEEAAEDPNTLAIKQTLYRVSDESPIMKSLIKAATYGKQVTVILEIKARMNEKDNLEWARKLEMAGGHVIYGVEGLKTHCKICMVVKKTKKGLKRYLHLGTGNYNDDTAKIYTDLSFFTSNRTICGDANDIFNMLTGFSEPTLKKLSYAPHMLRSKFYELIDNEINIAKTGGEGLIIAKMNSLVDKGMIDKLYEASQAGVKIQLNVRGECCLKANVPGLSDNIQVISVVGRFLEHSRIYYFKNGGNNSIFLSSADWMDRNLDRRFELLFPITGATLKNRVMNILNIMIKSTDNSYLLTDDTYTKIESDEKFSSQKYFMNESLEFNKTKNITRIFASNKINE